MAEFHDRTLVCKDCGSDFTFTAGEQHFFHDKQFKNEPKRCKECKTKRQGGKPSAKVETVVTCSGCSKDTTVPFRPTQGRPVFCRECFGNRKSAAARSYLSPPAGDVAAGAGLAADSVFASAGLDSPFVSSEDEPPLLPSPAGVLTPFDLA